MDTTTRTGTPLRQRMTEDMRMRKLEPRTQEGYIRAVRKLTVFLERSPDTATVEDLRNFQLHLVDTGTSAVTLNATLTGLKFFFDVTLGHAELMVKVQPVHQPRPLPVVLSCDEVARLMPRMLLDLQNRGQLAAGMSSYNPTREQLVSTYKEIGTVNEAFRVNNPTKFAEILREHSGRAAIGHTRYATCGPTNRRYAQPFERPAGGLHLQNLVNFVRAEVRGAVGGGVRPEMVGREGKPDSEGSAGRARSSWSWGCAGCRCPPCAAKWR